MSSSVPFLQSLHDAVAPAEDARGRPIWNEQAERWFVFDPPTASRILRSGNFSVVRHHEDIEALQELLGLDLRSTVEAAMVMPLSHEGERHRELKRLSAQLVQDSTAPAISSFTSFCSVLLPSLLENRRTFDLVTDFVSPISTRLFSALTGIDESHFNQVIPAGYCPTQLLTSAKRTLSAPRWKEIDRRIAERQGQTEGPALQRAMKGALSLLTFEIFKAALSNSLIHVFERNAGVPMNAMDMPDQLPSTSIPFIDRICHRDTEISGALIRSGDNVLLYLGGCSPSSPEQQRLFFGTGPHICIGKAVTENAWAALAELLRHRRERVAVRDVSFRDFDVILLSPDSALLEVMP